MTMLKILALFLLSVSNTLVFGQVKIRLFANQAPESATFSVMNGNYNVNGFPANNLHAKKGDIILISRYNGKLAVKKGNETGFICDSVFMSGDTDEASFYLRINVKSPIKQFYSGDLKCIPDFGTLLMINVCNAERYIAGVVKAEGGSGKYIEYFKTQAVLARTYMYKYMDKHIKDGYNVCDNTHCQAYNGYSQDSVLNSAAFLTKGQVIVDQDSILIISAFHSNCGGETASSEDVWLASMPYLRNVVDPYCMTSRNSVWEKTISFGEWTEFLKRSGYNGSTDDIRVFRFDQKTRVADYKTGTYSIPLRNIRNELNLRSTFFSVVPQGDTIVFKGRGYGHGVGLCQEGAMVMAAKSFNYKQIIDFYYSGVMILDIKNAVNLAVPLPPIPPKGGLKPY
jgi:stage II sporulation protein D